MTKLADVNLRAFGHTIMLAGAIYQGEGKTYLTFFPEDAKELLALKVGGQATMLNVELLEMDLSEWADFLQQTDHLLTEVAQKREDGTMIKAIVRKCERHIDNGVAWRVYRRDGIRCRYCGDDKVPLTVDHIICWEDGGPSTEENLLACCRNDNKARGTTPYEEWIRNHPHYRRVSQKLPFAVQEDNEAIIQRLDQIPRMVNIRSR